MIYINEYLKEYANIPVICGPTASGKSSLAMQVCERTGGELFSMDSMQIYKTMDIGTAKPTAEEQKTIPHHLIDLIAPNETFDPTQYLNHAYKEIESVLQRSRLPVFCGGTGQYAAALAKGIEYMPISIEPSVRETLIKEAEEKGYDSLYHELCIVDPDAGAKIHPNNQKRVLRALEIFRQTGNTMTQYNLESTKNGPKYPFVLFGIMVEREELYRKIERRVDEMIQTGLIQEVEKLLALQLPPNSTAMQAIGYKELIAYFAGLTTLPDAVDEIKKNTRHYAKRQMTWFSHMENITWIRPSEVETILQSIRC